ncbi:glycosyltransferase [Seohaeicola zhoushanensis]|uniref:Glycosyl transferase n=1 Tax=Seohaeicola zhoushanensis TaxID=1569283 RepID=A0A8J3M7R1_9RHOB|nr:glycosyltransferase [Seohaeicola zhoushanensis]GHF54545.1 glycosyl transferase [Seohaeicola zhoushanensis]
MSTSFLRLVDNRETESDVPQPRLPLGQVMVAQGAISQEQLVIALGKQLKLDASLGEIVVAEGWASRAQLQAALAAQFGIRWVDLAESPPDPALGALRTAGFWIRHKALPWQKLGDMLFIATARPEGFAELRALLSGLPFRLVPVLVRRDEVEAVIAEQFAPNLARAAETRLSIDMSCRRWSFLHRLGVALAGLAVLTGLALAPALALTALGAVAALATLLFAALRLVALGVCLTGRQDAPEPAAPVGRRPKVSVLVPLFRETEIAHALVQRLSRLTYPKALLEVVLVLEEHDDVTRQTLERTLLPSWMRVVVVPGYSGLTTKPRAMNYALDFCQGEIIGVWDAEDAPAADQIERVADRFATAPEDVVCLQGVLDFYNPRSSWIARCFALEYSAWFRVVMPALDRLRLVVPLGGTTLFFRRAALERLERWDAHSVTEDADLGMRLCRAGWRTEMVDTTTYEEATCRPWPWIKQRSRWLKGFMVTYLVHMASPWALWRDLGTRRFLSFQAFFIGTVCQFLLAPVLWSYWLILFGMGHPALALVPARFFVLAGSVIFAVELISVLVAGIGARRAGRGFLIPWIVTMPFYFVFGALAAVKAMAELVVAPHYWDKTQHGQSVAEPMVGAEPFSCKENVRNP